MMADVTREQDSLLMPLFLLFGLLWCLVGAIHTDISKRTQEGPQERRLMLEQKTKTIV